MRLRIRHRTTYEYSQPVSFGPHKIIIRPREGHDVHIESSILQITPAHKIHWMRDVNGTSIAKVDFLETASKLMFYSEVVLEQYDSNPFDFILDGSAVEYPFVYDPDTVPELAVFMTILYPRDTAALRRWIEQFWSPGERCETVTLLQRINMKIKQDFVYRRRDASGVQTPSETLQKNSGSCRDFATLMLEACRCLGLAARFVSGYMQCEATEAGGASTHAWMEVYLPGAGWKGFDPTSGCMTGSQHVPVAVSRNPENAAPVSGSYVGPANSFLGIFVDVTVEEIGAVKPPVPSYNPPSSEPVNVFAQQQQQQQPQQSSRLVGPSPPMQMVMGPLPAGPLTPISR